MNSNTVLFTRNYNHTLATSSSKQTEGINVILTLLIFPCVLRNAYIYIWIDETQQLSSFVYIFIHILIWWRYVLLDLRLMNISPLRRQCFGRRRPIIINNYVVLFLICSIREQVTNIVQVNLLTNSWTNPIVCLNHQMWLAISQQSDRFLI
jgi:hypothetical protein